jgi:hypothetical protein
MKKVGKIPPTAGHSTKRANGDKYQHLKIMLHINTLEVTSFTRANNSKEEINRVFDQQQLFVVLKL